MPLGNNPRRGDVVRVRLDPTEGSEQSGTRPSLVISADLVNEHAPIVLVASITSRKTERVYPFEALIEPPEGGLTMTSKVSLIQIRGVDKQRIIAHYGSVSAEVMERVEAALKIATGLKEI